MEERNKEARKESAIAFSPREKAVLPYNEKMKS